MVEKNKNPPDSLGVYGTKKEPNNWLLIKVIFYISLPKS